MDEHQSGVKLEEALEAKKELDAKAQKILEEKEADSRMRTYTGPLGRAGVSRTAVRVDGIPAVFHDHRGNQCRQSAGDPLYISSCFYIFAVSDV